MSETLSNRDFKGVWIPKEIWTNRSLSLLQKALLVEINSLDNKFGCVANNKYFADFFDTTPPSISNIIQKLKNGGFLIVTYKDELTKSGRVMKVVKEAFLGTNSQIVEEISQVDTPTSEMYPPTSPPTSEMEGATSEMYPPTFEVEHNNTFNNTFKYTSPIEAPNKFEIFNNPYWEMQKQTNFPDLTEKEIEISLGTYYLDYPSSKATQVFLFLKETNEKKLLAASKLEKAQSFGKSPQQIQSKVEVDLGRNNPLDRFKGRFALKKAYVHRQDFADEEYFKTYLLDLADLGVEIVGMDFENEQTKKSLPIPKPSFGKILSLEVYQRMIEIEATKNREQMTKQLENA